MTGPRPAQVLQLKLAKKHGLGGLQHEASNSPFAAKRLMISILHVCHPE
jgi:hypothetical protein